MIREQRRNNDLDFLGRCVRRGVCVGQGSSGTHREGVRPVQLIRARSLPALFALTLFIGSALIFVVEPMFAKMILPLLGGSPAVWNTCVVFFQAGLLAGYAYAHLLTTRLTVRQQAIAHGALVLLAAATLPVALRPGWTPPVEGTPVPWLLLVLTLGLGAPFMVVSATAPLLQKWFAGTDLPSARDPYYLYRRATSGASSRCWPTRS